MRRASSWPLMISMGWFSTSAASAHEVAGVAGAAQCVGAGDADLIRLDVGEALGEQGEAVEPPCHGLRGHAALLIHPLGEANPLLDAIDDLHPPLVEAGDDHVEAVRPQIDSGVQTIVHCLTLYV